MRVPLVGREPEIAVADHLLASAREGSGGGVLLVGEAGIGKTRLTIEIADHARASGFTVLTGRSAPGGGTYRALTEAVLEHLRNGTSLDDPSLRPYRAALGRLVPGWAGQDPPAATPELADPMLVLGEGLLRLLMVAGVAAAGCLLVLEDLHWADPDTVAIVGYLADAARHSSIMIAVTAWDDQPGAPRSIRPVDSVVGTLNRHDGMVTVWLDRLDEAGTAAMAAAHAAGRPIDGEALAALIDHADGLPLLVEDLLPAALGDLTAGAPMPRTMTDLVGRRMAELDPDARRVLQAAAVLGEEPDWSLVGSTAQLDAAAVSAGLRAGAGNGLLVRRWTQLVWRHNLTRAAVLAGLVPTERSVLVDRVSDLLLARGSDDDEALAADLLTQAGESARATAILLRLAGRDIDRGALHAAEDLLGQAASLGAPAAQLAIDRARLLTLLGRAGEALDVGIPRPGRAARERPRRAVSRAGPRRDRGRSLGSGTAAGRQGGPPRRPTVARPRGRGVVRLRRPRASHRNRPRRRRGGRARRCSRPAVRGPGHRRTMRELRLDRARRCGLRARSTVRGRARPRHRGASKHCSGSGWPSSAMGVRRARSPRPGSWPSISGC